MPPDSFEKAPEPTGWPFPTWGLGAGVVFVLLMTTGLGALVGFIVAYGVMMLGIPFLIMGADHYTPVAAFGCAAVLVFFALYPLGVAVFLARGRAARAWALNVFVMGVLVVAGLGVSVHTMTTSWV